MNDVAKGFIGNIRASGRNPTWPVFSVAPHVPIINSLYCPPSNWSGTRWLGGV